MGLANTLDILRHAEKYSYAVGAFNIINLEFLNGILEAAERMHSPVILNIAEAHFPYVNIEQITPAIRYMADNVCVPVVLNLDHGLSFETVVRALRCGFSSVMYDASKKSLEQNIEETRLVVRMAHAVGVSVEAELGRVGGAEGGGKARARREFFTNPDEAERFVAETGVDALAVAVGNAHGFYEETPELDFDLIAALRRRAGIPLVLHGGSGIPDDDFRRAISLGIRKINYFTEMSKLAADRVRELIRASDDYLLHDLVLEAKNRIREVVMERIRVFGSEGACSLPGAPCPSAGVCRAGSGSGAPAFAPSPIPVAGIAKPGEPDITALVAKVIADVLGGKRTT
jgi:fructose-bisphosphate aldolase class II